MFDPICYCNKLGRVDGDMICMNCGQVFHPCRYCPQIFYSSEWAALHIEECDSKTVLDEIIEAVDAAGNSGLSTTTDVAAGQVDDLTGASVSNGGMST